MRTGAIIAILACACGAGLPSPPYANRPKTAPLIEVLAPPPPARVEEVPAQPAADAVWIDGEWSWRARKWAWTLGRWVVPPKGATFSQWKLARGDDGTMYYGPGAWWNASGQEVPEPKALAHAGATSGPIVDPEGVVEPTGRNVDPDRDPRARARTRADGGT